MPGVMKERSEERSTHQHQEGRKGSRKELSEQASKVARGRRADHYRVEGRVVLRDPKKAHRDRLWLHWQCRWAGSPGLLKQMAEEVQGHRSVVEASYTLDS